MYQLKVKDHFDAAHQLDDYIGKCHNLHGHRWDVEVCLQGEKLDKTNMLIDFSVVKSILKNIFERYLDHMHLNERLVERNPSAEFLAEWIYNLLNKWMEQYPILLIGVTVWESPECSVTYSCDNEQPQGVAALFESMKVVGGK